MKGIFNTWEGVYYSFREASAEAVGPGFNGDVWRSRSLNSAKECMQALNAGVAIPSFYKQRSTLLPSIVAMMLDQKKTIDILDLGGGLGIGYMTLAESIPLYNEHIRYTIIEVPEICELGRELFSANNNVTYNTSLPHEEMFNLVHSASALQYIEDWKTLLKKFTLFNPEYIFLSDVFAGSHPTFVTLQNYYGSRIPHWFFNLDDLLAFISSLGYELIMKAFVSAKRLDVEDILPMENFPESHRLNQSLHLLFKKSNKH